MSELAQVRERLEQYLMRWSGGQSVTVGGLERMAAGWETDVIGFAASGGPFGSGRGLVLRLYHGERVEPRAAAEGQAMQGLREEGYPVPEVVAWELDRDWFGGPFLVMERVRGRQLWQAVPERQASLERLCDLMARLHRVDPARFAGETGPWDRSGTFTLPFLWTMMGWAGLERAFAPLLERLEAWEPSVGRTARCLIHGDLHSENVLVTEEGRPYVIDWSAAAIDDPRADVAQTAALAISAGRPERVGLIRSAYEAAAGTSLEGFDYFLLLALARRLGSVLFVMERGSAALGMRPGLEEAFRQNRALVRRLLDVVEQASGVPLPQVARLLEE